MWRLAFWALNAWSAKKGFDLLKENVELKQKNDDLGATVRTLASQVTKKAPLVHKWSRLDQGQGEHDLSL